MLLVCAEYAGMADCAKQLAAQGFCRELAWKDRGKEQLTALFCRMAAPELPELEDGYEQQPPSSRLPSWSGCAATFP